MFDSSELKSSIGLTDGQVPPKFSLPPVLKLRSSLAHSLRLALRFLLYFPFPP